MIRMWSNTETNRESAFYNNLWYKNTTDNSEKYLKVIIILLNFDKSDKSNPGEIKKKEF